MNGEFLQLYNKVDSRLTVLEAINTERWSNHDKRSDENWSHIKSQLAKLDNLPCGVHLEKMKSINVRFGLLWSVLVLSIAILGLAIRIQ